MKISWGVGITITIIVFMLLTLGFVYFAFNQGVNLVRDDYYEAEVQHNESMETAKRTSKLTDNLKINVVNNNIELLFPDSFLNKGITGNVYLYRPSDGKLDLNIPIQIDSSNLQTITTAKLIPGMWEVKVDWRVDSVMFQTDKVLILQ